MDVVWRHILGKGVDTFHFPLTALQNNPKDLSSLSLNSMAPRSSVHEVTVEDNSIVLLLCLLRNRNRNRNLPAVN